MTVIGLHGQGGPNVAQIVVGAISHGQEHVTTHHQKMVAITVVWMEVYQQSKGHAIEKDVTLINRGIYITKKYFLFQTNIRNTFVLLIAQNFSCL